MDKQERFSIRKLTVGVASVTIGFWLAGTGNIAHADTVDGNVNQTEVKIDNTSSVDKTVAQSTNTDTQQDAKNQTNNSDVVKSTDTEFVKSEQEKDQTQTDVANNSTLPIDTANVAKSSSVSKDVLNKQPVVASNKTNSVNDTFDSSTQTAKQLDNTSVKTNVSDRITTDTHYVGGQHIKIDDTFKAAFPKSFTVGDSLKYKDLADQQFKKNTYQSDPVAKTESVDINNLTNDQLLHINKYTTDMINGLRHTFGIDRDEDYKINTDLMNWQQDKTKKQADRNIWGHNSEYLHGAGENVGALPMDNSTGRSISELKPSDFNFTYDANAKTITTWSPAIAVKTMDDLYAFSYYMTSIFMFEDYGIEANSHAENFTFTNRGPKQYSELGIYPATDPKTKKTNLFFRWIVPNADTFMTANVDGNKNNISADPGPVNKQVIHLIDDTDSSNKLNDVVISNQANTILNAPISVPTNYVLAKNNTLPSTFDFTNGDLPDLTVHVEHNIETVNDTRNNATETIRIHYVDNKGNKLKDDTTVQFAFHRDYTIDKATGKSTVGAWEYVPNSMTQTGTYVKDIGEPGKHYNSVNGYDSFNFWIPFNVSIPEYNQKYSGLTASLSIPNESNYLYDGNLNVDQNIVYESTRKGYISNLKPDDVLNIQDDAHANTTGDFIVNLQLPDKYKSLIPESKTTFHIQFHRLYGTDKISGKTVWGPWQFVSNTADGFGSNRTDIAKLTVRDSLSVDDFTNDIYFDPNESSKESHYDVFKLTDGSLKSQIRGLIPYFKNMGLDSYATMKIPNDDNHPSKVTVTLNEAVGVDETIKHPLNIQVKDRATNKILYQTSMNVLLDGTTLSSDDIQKVNGYTYESSTYNPVEMFSGQMLMLPDWIILADKDKAKPFTINVFDDDLMSNGQPVGVIGTLSVNTNGGYDSLKYSCPDVLAGSNLSDYIITQVPTLGDGVTIAGDNWAKLTVGGDASSLSIPNWRIDDLYAVSGKTFTFHIRSAHSNVFYKYVDADTGKTLKQYSLGTVKTDSKVDLLPVTIYSNMPDHYYLDNDYQMPTDVVASQPTIIINIPVHKAHVLSVTFYDQTDNTAYRVHEWDGINANKHLTGTSNDINNWIKEQCEQITHGPEAYRQHLDISKTPEVATITGFSWDNLLHDVPHSGSGAPNNNGDDMFINLSNQNVDMTINFKHNFEDLTGESPMWTPSSVYIENDNNLKTFINNINSNDNYNDIRLWTHDMLSKLNVNWTSGGTLSYANGTAFTWGSVGGYLGNPTYQWPALSAINKHLTNAVSDPDTNANIIYGSPYMIPMSTKNYDLFSRRTSEPIYFDLSKVLPAVTEKHEGYHVEVLTNVYDKTTKSNKWKLIPVTNTNVRDETSIFDLLNKELNMTFGKTLDKSEITSLVDVNGELLTGISDMIRPNIRNQKLILVPTSAGRYEYKLDSDDSDDTDGLFSLEPVNISSENEKINELVPYVSGMYREALIKAAQMSNMSDFEYMGNIGYQNPSVMAYTIVPDDETATIKYINDDTNEVLNTDTTTGKFDSSISFTTNPSVTIANYEKQGYKVVSNTYKSGINFNTTNNFEVHLTKKIDNTINYVDNNGEIVKTDKITDFPGEDIKLDVPDGYHIDGNVPTLVADKDKPVQTVNVIENKHETGTPETITKDVLNVINYIDENGKTIKTDHVTGNDGDKITVNIPDGYHIDGDIPVLTIDSTKPVQTVNVVENKHETDTPETSDRDVLNIVKYVDGTGNIIKIDHVTGKVGDSISIEIPDGYHIDKTPKLTIKPDTGIQTVNIIKNVANTDNPLTNDNPAFDIKHESGDPLTNDKPAYDLDKIKKHETGDPLVDDKSAYDLNKVKKHETGDPLTDDKPAYDLNKVKKHETDDPLVDDKPAYDLDKIKKHETGDPLTDDKPAYDLDHIKKHETGNVDVKTPVHEEITKATEQKPAKKVKVENVSVVTEQKPAKKVEAENVSVVTEQKPAKKVNTVKTINKQIVMPGSAKKAGVKLTQHVENAQTKRKTLPQTGANNSLAVIGLGIASVLASLGLGKSRKRKN